MFGFAGFVRRVSRFLRPSQSIQQGHDGLYPEVKSRPSAASSLRMGDYSSEMLKLEGQPEVSAIYWSLGYRDVLVQLFHIMGLAACSRGMGLRLIKAFRLPQLELSGTPPWKQMASVKRHGQSVIQDTTWGSWHMTQRAQYSLITEKDLGISQYLRHALALQVPKDRALKGTSIPNSWSLGALWGVRDIFLNQAVLGW